MAVAPWRSGPHGRSVSATGAIRPCPGRAWSRLNIPAGVLRQRPGPTEDLLRRHPELAAFNAAGPSVRDAGCSSSLGRVGVPRNGLSLCSCWGACDRAHPAAAPHVTAQGGFCAVHPRRAIPRNRGIVVGMVSRSIATWETHPAVHRDPGRGQSTSQRASASSRGDRARGRHGCAAVSGWDQVCRGRRLVRIALPRYGAAVVAWPGPAFWWPSSPIGRRPRLPRRHLTTTRGQVIVADRCAAGLVPDPGVQRRLPRGALIQAPSPPGGNRPTTRGTGRAAAAASNSGARRPS